MTDPGANAPGEVVLNVPARPEYLSLVRQVVAVVATAEGVRDDRVEALRIAVSEATTNAMESYAARAADRDDPGPVGRIEVRAALHPDRVVVEVGDEAGGFEPSAVGDTVAPDDPGRLDAERGRGLALMGHLADEWDITTSDEGTLVRLVVRTPWRAPVD